MPQYGALKLRQNFPKNERATILELLNEFGLTVYGVHGISQPLLIPLTKPGGAIQYYVESMKENPSEARKHWKSLIDEVKVGFEFEKHHLNRSSPAYIAHENNAIRNPSEPKSLTTAAEVLYGNKGRVSNFPMRFLNRREALHTKVIHAAVQSHCNRVAQEWRERHLNGRTIDPKKAKRLYRSAAARFFNSAELAEFGVNITNDRSRLTAVELVPDGREELVATIRIGRNGPIKTKQYNPTTCDHVFLHLQRPYKSGRSYSYSHWRRDMWPIVCPGSFLGSALETAKWISFLSGKNETVSLDYLLFGWWMSGDGDFANAGCTTAQLGYDEEYRSLSIPREITMKIPPNLSQDTVWKIYRDAHLSLEATVRREDRQLKSKNPLKIPRSGSRLVPVLSCKATRPEEFERNARLVLFLLGRGLVGKGINRPNVSERRRHFEEWNSSVRTDWDLEAAKHNESKRKLITDAHPPGSELPEEWFLPLTTGEELRRLNGNRDPNWAFPECKRFVEGCLRAVDMLLGDRRLCAFYRRHSAQSQPTENIDELENSDNE